MADATSETDAVVVAQPVSAPLTRAAIFLVVTINHGRGRCRRRAVVLRRLRGPGSRGRISRSRGRPLLRDGNWLRRLGPAVRRAASGRTSPVPRVPAGSRHAIATPGDLLFHIRAKRMDLCFEIAAQIMAKLGDAVTRGRRGARLSLFRRPRPSGLRRRDGKSARAGGDRRRAHRRRGCRLRRRQLRDHAEISARSRRMERAADRNAGADHRPHQALRHRARRCGQADVRA